MYDSAITTYSPCQELNYQQVLGNIPLTLASPLVLTSCLKKITGATRTPTPEELTRDFNEQDLRAKHEEVTVYYKQVPLLRSYNTMPIRPVWATYKRNLSLPFCY